MLHVLTSVRFTLCGLFNLSSLLESSTLYLLNKTSKLYFSSFDTSRLDNHAVLLRLFSVSILLEAAHRHTAALVWMPLYGFWCCCWHRCCYNFFAVLCCCLPGLFSTISQKVVLVQSQVTFLLCLWCLEVLLYYICTYYQLTWNRNQISGYLVTPWDDLWDKILFETQTPVAAQCAFPQRQQNEQNKGSLGRRGFQNIE